jgi:hypothetical protein
MLRVVLGLLKGGLVGAGIGALAFKLGVTSGLPAFVAYGLVGGLVGIVAGRPPWRQETMWTSLLKGIFGFGIGLLLYWGAHKLLGGVPASFAAGLGLGVPAGKALVDVPFLLGPAIGALWGILVEIDDSAGSKPSGKAGSKAASPAPVARK